MNTPFGPQELTDAQKKQIENRQLADALIGKILATLVDAHAAFTKAEAYSESLTAKAEQFPAEEVDANEMVRAEGEYLNAENLVRNLGYYLGAAQGWRNGEWRTLPYPDLLARSKGNWPDAFAAVGVN